MTDQQLTEADLATMTPEQIEAARAAGRLRVLLGGPSPVPAVGQLTAEHVTRMTPEEIVTAQDAGRLDLLLGRQPGSADPRDVIGRAA